MTEFEVKETVYLPVDCLLDDPEQIRPEVGSVADIEPSIIRDGIINPIDVRAAGEDGMYFVCEGKRRVFTARKVGLTVVPAHIRDLDASGARKLMMVSDLRRAQPHVVVRRVDGVEQIVGGLAVAVRREKEDSGMTNQELAEMLGDRVTSDTVGAYLSLFDENMEVVKAVASGKLAITAYSRMKRQPLDVKLAVIGKDKDSISANDVRDEIKRQRRKGGDESADLPYMGDDAAGDHMDRLTGLLSVLRSMQGADFSNAEIGVLEMIAEQAGRLASN